jgi:AcrR family transcriptional regulator
MKAKRRSAKKIALRKISKSRPKRGTMAAASTSRRRMNVSRTKPEPSTDRRNTGAQDAILAAARKLVRRHGYNRVTIEAIAAGAGSGKQTIYRWWPTKAALFLELYTSLAAEAKLKTTNSGSVTKDLRNFLNRVLRVFATTPAKAILAGLIAEAPADRTVARALTEALVRRRRHLVRDIFVRAQRGGDVRRNADLDFAVDTISSAIWFRLILGHAALDKGFVDRLLTQIMRGIGAK